MKIQVVGAGSVGLLISSFFAQFGNSVTVVCRTEEQASALNEFQLQRVNIDETVERFSVKATTVSMSDADVTFVTVKAGHLTEMLHTLNKQIPTVFCQNGLTHFYMVPNYPFTKPIFCSIQFGAMRVNYHTVMHRGIGSIKLAALHEKTLLKKLQRFSQLNFPIEIENDAEKMLFHKALKNCFINPLTAIMEIKNGDLVENTYTYKVMKQLHRELMLAFPNDCIPFEEVVDLCIKTSANTSSMLADHLAKRKSEAPFIVEAVLNKAKKSGREIPTLQLLYHLILAKEEARDFK